MVGCCSMYEFSQNIHQILNGCVIVCVQMCDKQRMHMSFNGVFYCTVYQHDAILLFEICFLLLIAPFAFSSWMMQTL